MSSSEELADGVLARKPASVARAITMVERTDPGLAELLAKLYPAAGGATVVGVTGPPGTGKSTLVSAMAVHARTEGKRVAILAVDPSSSITGGALLGDRIRMFALAGDPDVYIRSMATRGSVGGLARAAMDAATVLDAAGFDLILVETVGVGQAEVDVVALAHTVLVVSVPGLGDGVQALKAGLLEIADVHVVNKADREGADRTAKELLDSLRLRRREAEQWNVPVLKSTATTADGVAELMATIDKHTAWLNSSGQVKDKLRTTARERIRWAATDLALSRVRTGRNAPDLIDRVAQHDIDPLTAATQLLDGGPDVPIEAVPDRRAKGHP